MSHDLRCDKEFFPGNSAFLDGNPKFSLGVVDFSAIQMIITKLDSSLDSVDGLPVNAIICSTFKPGGAGWNLLKQQLIRIGSIMILTAITKLCPLAN